MFILQKIPTQNNLREDEIRGATSIIGFLLSLIPVSGNPVTGCAIKGTPLRIMFFSLISNGPNLTAFSACFQQPQALCERKDCNFSIFYFLASR